MRARMARRHILLPTVALAGALAMGPSSHAATTYGCGNETPKLRVNLFVVATGETQCGIVSFTLSAPATGTLRVRGEGFTGRVYGIVQNASAGAKCIGEGQEGYLWGCSAGSYFVNGVPNADPGLFGDDAERPVQLTAGTFKLGAQAQGYGPFRIELVLD